MIVTLRPPATSGIELVSQSSKKRGHHVSSVFNDIKKKTPNENNRDRSAAEGFWHSGNCSMINTNGHPVGIRDSKSIHQSCTQQYTLYLPTKCAKIRRVHRSFVRVSCLYC